MLTLRDPQSSKSHAIPPEGATIGREGGRADILVRNPSVSKEHARLFSADGAWWLEDLGSANGTFVNNGRISEPTQLAPGLVFALSSYKFEVASIGQEQKAPSPSGNQRVQQRSAATEKGPAFDPVAVARAKPNPAPTPVPRAQPQVAAPRTKSASMRPSPQPENGSDGEAFAPTSTALPPRGKAAQRPAPAHDEMDEPQDEASAPGESPASEFANLTFGAAMGVMMKELPKAIAYYIATVPKLLLNPLGTIRKSIEEQRFEGMRGIPLMGWALPGLAASGAVGLLCTLIIVIVTAIRGGGFAIGALIGGIIATAIIGVVGGLAVAFLYHPVMGFIIRLLKGESDEKSRTNYLIISQAAGVLFAVPNGVLGLITAFAILIPVAPVVALLPILPSLLGLGATLITLALTYQWLKFFQVHKIVPTIVLVLGALAALGTLWGVIGSVRVAVASIGSGGTVHVASVDMAQAEAAAEEARALGSKAVLTPDAKKALADARKAAAAAAQATPEKAAAGEPTKPSPTPSEAHAEEPPARTTLQPAEPAAEAPKHVVAAARPVASPEESPPAGGSDGTGYQHYVKRRDTIERMIEADPTLLTKNDEILGLYKRIHTLAQNVKKGHSSKGSEDVVTQRLIEAETYEKTGKLVDDLYQRLTH